MIALAIVLAYFAIGYFSARAVFAKRLGDSPRYERQSAYSRGRSATSDFETASMWGALTLFFWPIVGLIFGVVHGATPHEKQLEREERQRALEYEQKTLALRFKQLEREVLDFGKGLDDA